MQRTEYTVLAMMHQLHSWAARYYAGLLIKLTPKGVVFVSMCSEASVSMAVQAMLCKQTWIDTLQGLIYILRRALTRHCMALLFCQTATLVADHRSVATLYLSFVALSGVGLTAKVELPVC